MTVLYLDLEGTVINSWNDPVLMNISRLHDFLDANPDIDIDDVRVFSFAVYNQQDVDDFAQGVRPMLERALSVTITQCPSLYDMAKASQKLSGHRWIDQDTGDVNIHDYVSIVGKVNAFEDWVNYHHDAGSRTILVDDIVPMKTIINHTLGLQVDYINVDKLGV